jgi:iron complex transport system ATP-binding protein
LLLACGQVARFGPPDEVLREDVLRDVYGCDVIVDKSPTGARPRVQIAWP